MYPIDYKKRRARADKIVTKIDLRDRLKEGQRRCEVQLDHGFRKYFNTMMRRAKVDYLDKEDMMGHKVGLEKHKGTEHEGKYFIKRYQRFCYRGDCEKCHKKWMSRESNKATNRILQFQKDYGKKVRHIVVSPPKKYRDLPIKKVRKKIYSILKQCGVVGGVIIFHPFRLKNKQWHYFPHFHILAFGFATFRPDLRHKVGGLSRI